MSSSSIGELRISLEKRMASVILKSFKESKYRERQIDGVAMGSPLGPLMANIFLCHLEDKLTRDGMMPTLYKRYVDDALVRMPSTAAATEFLTTLNSLHPSLSHKFVSEHSIIYCLFSIQTFLSFTFYSLFDLIMTLV